MIQAYSDPKRESNPYALPDIEIFEAAILVCTECSNEYPDYSGESTPGASCPSFGCDGSLTPKVPAEDRWWWWSCSPGCMPDGEPSGPFETEDEALADAREGMDEEDPPDSDPLELEFDFTDDQIDEIVRRVKVRLDDVSRQGYGWTDALADVLRGED
jgi:hypothetical protein